jgi:hypothetical protein
MTGQSDYFSAVILPADAVFAEIGEGSAISKPYSSLLSLVVELGVLQFAFLCCVVLVAFAGNVRLMRSSNPRASAIGFLANAGVLFFALCCTIENYAEFPQAIFLPLLLYVTAQSNARVHLEDDVARVGVEKRGRPAGSREEFPSLQQAVD